MASGQSVSSRANLTRAGGDRRAGERAMIAVIAAELAAALSDAEVRRFFGLAVGQEVTAAHRERMAAGKAKKTYRAILEAWSDGMATPLESGGVNIGGIIRLGTRARQGVALQAQNNYGQDLAALGVQKYKRLTLANGFYGRAWGGMTDTAAKVADLIAAGWVVHWSEAWSGGAASSCYWGPVAGGAVSVLAPVGGRMVAVPVEYCRWGTKTKDGSGTYAWAYVDSGGHERQVKWVNAGVAKRGRVLKAEIPNLFWCELNGVVP